MIFGSFGLLVVALALLITAIIKSSVAIGVASLVCTGLAVAFLVAANAYYRKAMGVAPNSPLDQLRPSAAAAPTTVMMMPSPAVPQMAMAGGGSPNGNHARPDSPPIEHFETLSATKAAAAVELLNLDELHEARRFEIEHEARKSVLAAIDGRISELVRLRRSLDS